MKDPQQERRIRHHGRSWQSREPLKTASNLPEYSSRILAKESRGHALQQFVKRCRIRRGHGNQAASSWETP
jgi:hypothetical protein